MTRTHSNSPQRKLNRLGTRGGDVLVEAFNMDAPLEVLPDLQPSGCRVQEVGDDLLVDFQEAASAYEPHFLPFPLWHTLMHCQ